MKKFLIFYVSFMGFLGCSSYKVKNDAGEDIKVGGTTVAVGQCGDVSGGFFGMGSDFPLTFTKAEGGDKIGNDEYTEKTNYKVTASGVEKEEKEDDLGCSEEVKPDATPAEQAEAVYSDTANAYNCTKADGTVETVNQGSDKATTVATLTPYFEDENKGCVVKEDNPTPADPTPAEQQAEAVYSADATAGYTCSKEGEADVTVSQEEGKAVETVKAELATQIQDGKTCVAVTPSNTPNGDGT